MSRGRNGCSQEGRVVGQKIMTRSQLTALLHLMFAQQDVPSTCSQKLDALIELARQLQILHSQNRSHGYGDQSKRGNTRGDIPRTGSKRRHPSEGHHHAGCADRPSCCMRSHSLDYSIGPLLTSYRQSPLPTVQAPSPAPARTGTPAHGSRAASAHPDPGLTIPSEAAPHGDSTRRYLNTKVTGVLLEGMKQIAKDK